MQYRGAEALPRNPNNEAIVRSSFAFASNVVGVKSAILGSDRLSGAQVRSLPQVARLQSQYNQRWLGDGGENYAVVTAQSRPDIAVAYSHGLTESQA